VLAAYAARRSFDDPLSALEVGDIDPPAVPDGWVTVELRSASLNHHDIWSLRGVGLPEDRLPMILGCDAAGVTESGEEVVLHTIVADAARGGGNETNDPERTLLSELHPGTFAERVAVPARNLIPKPAFLNWAQAGCLSTAWLTAYRMLFTRGQATAGQTVLVQGAGGGVATAATAMAKAAGLRVWVTSRSEAKRSRALDVGADQAFEPGARLPERVDLVVETVGEATFNHSMKAVRPGGKVIVSGSTSGANPPIELQRLFFLQLDLLGSTMGSKDEFEAMLAFLAEHDLRPLVDSTYPLAEAREAFLRLERGDVFGKIVLTWNS